MFWNNTDYKAKAEELTKQLATISAAKVELEQKLEEAKESMESSAHEYSGYKKQISAYKKSLEELKEIHAAELKAMQTSINKKINDSLASVGVCMFANDNVSVINEPSDASCLTQFNALSGNEKTEYYNKNKAKITRALLNQSKGI